MNSHSAPKIIELGRLIALIALLVAIYGSRSVIAQSSSSNQKVINEVLAHIYDYEFSSATQMLDSLQGEQPSATEWHLLRANVAWWQILAGKVDDAELVKVFEANLDAVTQQLDKKDLSLEETYQVILVRAFEARFALLDENYISGIRQLNACIDQISETFGSEGQFEPLYLTSGLYYYFMHHAHDDYLFLRPYLMFFPDGDKPTGLNYLERMSKAKDVFLRNEGHYFLLRIYYDLEKDYVKSRSHVNALLDRHPDNLIYRLFSYKIEVALGDEVQTEQERQLYLGSISRNSELDSDEKEFYQGLLDED